jgi:hypothetical protein
MRNRIKVAVIAAVAASVGSALYGVAGAVSPGAPPSPNAPNAAVAHAQAAAVSVPAGTQNDVFTPIRPCRIADTRLGGGIIVNGATRTLQVTGSTGFTGQGGTSTGCGIPSTADAVALSLTAVGETSSGHVTVYPSGTPRPLATALSFSKAVTITGNTDATIGSAGQISAFVGASGGTHLVVDVDGYYSPQIHAVLSAGGGILSGTPLVLSNTHLGTGSYRVQIGRDLTGCTPIASINGSAFIASSYISGGFVYANTYTTSGTPLDLYWTLSVFC